MTSRELEKKVEEIERLLAKTTPTPWEWSQDGSNFTMARLSGGDSRRNFDSVEDEGYLKPADCALIVAVMNNLEALLKDWKRMREAEERELDSRWALRDAPL